MEAKVEEESKPKKLNLITATPDWLDLPEPITTNMVLEHLDVISYIRFSAVCKRWQSIQKVHRILYSPHPPPSPISYPWLICNACTCNFHSDDEKSDIHLYLPNEQKSYNIPFHKTPKMVIEVSTFAYGWLLLLLKFDENDESFCIFNPITGVQIELPLSVSKFYDAYVSSPPTDPDCTIILLDYDNYIYLYRLQDNCLIKTDCSVENDWCRHFICRNKFYSTEHYGKIHMVDVHLREPVKQTIEMDCSEIYVDTHTEKFHLMDFLGELVIIVVGYENLRHSVHEIYKEFHVYRADFLRNKWVKMESLGDHVLFFSSDNIFSLPAVDTGCRKNCIYSAGSFRGNGVAWSAFDISTKNWVDGPLMACTRDNCKHFYGWSWFLPILDYYSFANRDGTCGIQLK